MTQFAEISFTNFPGREEAAAAKYSEVHIYLQESADRESKEDGFTQPLSEKFALPSASKINKVAADAAAGLV